MPIPQETISEIRERADIVEVVSRFVDLRRAGVNFKAVCPFHEERTPSFVVSPQKQIFHCFGCGKGGNVFTFVMEMEGVTFPEAVRSLGRLYGIPVPTEAADEDKSKNEELYRVCDFAARWYHRNLLEDAAGAPARRYLASRDIPRDAWETFHLGYSGGGRDRFYRAAVRSKVPVDALASLKLVVSREQDGGYFDYFRDRVMFPITLLSGRTVAFGARTLEKAGEPKYLNSIESPIYQKRRILYGLPQARDAVRKERSAILVEGYIDCISLHVKGFEHVVATCGTALTPEHGGLLRRLTHLVVLAPDGDTAGRDAALVSGLTLLAAGLDVRVAGLETGTDPDSAVRAQGAGGFAKIVGGAVEYFEYLDYIVRERPMTPREKEGLVQRLLGGLVASGDPLRNEVILQDLARVLRVPPESLRGGRRVDRAAAAGRTAGRGAKGTEPDRRSELERTLLRLLQENTPEVAEAREKLVAEDFSQENHRKFYKLLDSAWENHIDIRSHSFQEKAEEADLEGLAAELALISIPPGNPGRLLEDTVRRIKELQIRDELEVLRGKLQELPEESEEAVAVAEHYARLKRALSEL